MKNTLSMFVCALAAYYYVIMISLSLYVTSFSILLLRNMARSPVMRRFGPLFLAVLNGLAGNAMINIKQILLESCHFDFFSFYVKKMDKN